MKRLRAVTLVVVAALLWTSTARYGVATASTAELTVAELKQRYPNARLLQVSPAEFERIRNTLQGDTERAVGAKASLLIARAEPTASARPAAETNAVGTAETNAVPTAPAAIGPISPEPAATAMNTAVSPVTDESSCNALFDILNTDWGNDTDVVIFVVIGVVAVAALVVYAGAYAYNMATHAKKYEYWFDVQSHADWIASGSESGYLLGGRLATGFSDGHARAGIAAEFGHLDLTAELDGAHAPLSINGTYVMAGPAIRWTFDAESNPWYCFVELLGGATDQHNAKMISAARTGLDLGFGERLRFGLSLGALYLGLEPDEGVARRYDNFSTLLGSELGFRF